MSRETQTSRRERSTTVRWVGRIAFVAAVGATPAAIAQVDNEAASQMRFTRGRQLFQQRQFEQALTEFRAALDLVRSPNIRINIGRSLRALNRNAEALIEFQRAAAEASDRAGTEARYAATRDAARSEAAQVEPLVGRLSLRVADAPAGTTVSVASRELPSASWGLPTPMDPRDVEVVARAPGRLEFRRRVTIRAGATEELTVELAVDPNARRAVPPAPTSSTASIALPVTTRVVRTTTGGGVRIAGAVFTGLGVVGGGGFALFGLLAQNRFNELRMMCGAAGCGPERNNDLASGQTLVTLANVSLIAGAVSLTAGVIMIAAGGPREVLRTESVAASRSPRAPGPAASVRWSIAPRTDGASFELGARF